jgi:hypothetical protein
MVAGQQQAEEQAQQGGGDGGPEDEQNPVSDGLMYLPKDIRRQLGLDLRPENDFGIAADLTGQGRWKLLQFTARQGGLQCA